MILLANAFPFLQWMVDFIHWAKGMGAAGGVLYAVFYILGTGFFFPGLPLTLGAKKYPQTAILDRAIEKNGFKAVVLLRLQPVLPFNVLNYALGLTSIRLRDYMLASW